MPDLDSILVEEVLLKLDGYSITSCEEIGKKRGRLHRGEWRWLINLNRNSTKEVIRVCEKHERRFINMGWEEFSV